MVTVPVELVERRSAASEYQDVAARLTRIVIAEARETDYPPLKRLLSAEPGFEVVGEAADPDTLTRLLQESNPDILLLRSPFGNECDSKLLRRLNAGTINSRVILITAWTRHEDQVRAVRCGAAGILAPDAAATLLADGIRKVSQGELWVDRRTAADAIRQLIASTSAVKSRASTPLQGHSASVSKREMEVAVLVAQGFRNKEIAGRLFISQQTVKNHMHSLFQKLSVSDRLELALSLIHRGLV